MTNKHEAPTSDDDAHETTTSRLLYQYSTHLETGQQMVGTEAIFGEYFRIDRPADATENRKEREADVDQRLANLRPRLTWEEWDGLDVAVNDLVTAARGEVAAHVLQSLTVALELAYVTGVSGPMLKPDRVGGVLPSYSNRMDGGTPVQTKPEADVRSEPEFSPTPRRFRERIAAFFRPSPRRGMGRAVAFVPPAKQPPTDTTHDR